MLFYTSCNLLGEQKFFKPIYLANQSVNSGMMIKIVDVL